MTTSEMLEFMLEYIPENYDTSAGSFFYDLLYPVAEKLCDIYKTVEFVKKNAFAKTAVGEYLDRKATEQGLTRHDAQFATGIVRISGQRGAIVREGSLVASDTLLFSVNTSATIPEDGYVDVPAICKQAGAKGNVLAGEINRFPITLPEITDVVNLEAFTGGYNAESDDSLRERYYEEVARPNASGNKYEYISWAKKVPGIGEVTVEPLWNGPGTVKVVITDTNNRPASADKVAEVAAYIEQERPVGADVTVVSVEALTIDVSVTLIARDEFDTSSIRDALTNYLSFTAYKKGYVSYSKIGSVILAVEGVDDYTDLRVNGGTARIEIPTEHAPVLGTLTVLWDHSEVELQSDDNESNESNESNEGNGNSNEVTPDGND